MLALQYLKKQNYKLTLQKLEEARQWPKVWGAGASYPNMGEQSLEDEIQNLIIQKHKGQKLSNKVIDDYLRKVKNLVDLTGK